MSTKNRDSCCSSSLQGSTPQSSRTPKGRLPSEEAVSSSCAGSKGPGLIVTRGLYKVLEQEMDEGRSPKIGANPRSSRQMSRPNFLFCYLCGQQFGSASLSIHQPQCYVKKLIEWKRMDPLKRGPRPLDPEAHEAKMKAMGLTASSDVGPAAKDQMKSSGIDRFNEMQIQSFNENMMSKCENCGRTFLPDRLEVHQRSCKPGSAGASKPVTRSLSGSTMGKQRAVASRALSAGVRNTRSAPECVPLNRGSIRAVTANSDRMTTDVTNVPPSQGAIFSQDSVGCDNLDEKDPLASTQPGTDFIAFHDSTIQGTKNAMTRVVLSPTEIDEEIMKDGGPNSEDHTATDAERVCQGESVARGKTHHTPKNGGDLEAVVVEGGGGGFCKSDISSDGIDSSRSQLRNRTHAVAFSAIAADVVPDSKKEEDAVTLSKSTVKILFNNVSRFKNVPSRLKMENQKPPELPRCRYCNRTFNADRLAKHEDVCLERSAKSQRQSASASHDANAKEKKECGSEVTHKTRTAQSARNTRIVAAAETLSPSCNPDFASGNCVSSGIKTRAKSMERAIESTKQRFCMECGEKLHSGTQKFCAECGAKIPV